VKAHPDLGRSAPDVASKISQTQISAERLGSSRNRSSTNATMFAGSSIARQRTSDSPYRGV
jgi:hypothetical protein